MNQIKAPVARKKRSPSSRVSALGSSAEGGTVSLPRYIQSEDGKCLGIAAGHKLQFEHFLCSKFEPSAHWMLEGSHLKARSRPHLCLARGASDNVKVINCDVTTAGWATRPGNTSSDEADQAGPRLTVDGSDKLCMTMGDIGDSTDTQ